MGDTDTTKLEDFEDTSFISDLKGYTAAIAPQFNGLVSALAANEEVEVGEISKLLSRLSDEVEKNMGPGGAMSDETLKLEDMIAKIGGQL